ncbi:MAG: DUF188 domain-containing protein [Mycoplasmatota bacterium]
MRIVIDADACPNVYEIINIAQQYKIKILIVADDSHVFKNDYADIVICETGYQSADMYILNNLKKEDIVITQDYGVAVIALSKVYAVIHPTGFLYDETISEMMEIRHIHAVARKSGIKVKGPKKRKKEDSKKLLSLIEEQIKNYLKR